jgi:uncharacterized protein YbaA (DUF1428 family)
MSYIDGFVIPVPEGKKEQYLELAKNVRQVQAWGAIRHVECWGDDVPDGKVTNFKRAVDAKPGETIVFSWVEWPSKRARDEANKKMMEDPNFKNINMPFDGKRMIFGGFIPIVQSHSSGLPKASQKWNHSPLALFESNSPTSTVIASR